MDLAQKNCLQRLLILCLFSILGATNHAEARSLAYVTNTGSNTVSVIDTTTNAVVATIPVGVRPSGIAINPAGTFAYASNYDSGTVSVIDTLTQSVVASIPVGGAPVGVVFTPDGARAYVASCVTGVVSVIDVATHAVIASVSGFAFGDVANNPPGAMAVTRDGAYVLVANAQGTLQWIATSTNTVVASLNLPVPNEGYVTLTRDGRFAYVDGFYGYITKVDLTTRAVVDSFSVTNGQPGPALWQLGATGDGTTLYAVSGGFNQVYVIDTTTTQTLTAIAVGSAPRGLALKTGKAYVTNEGGTTVSVIDTVAQAIVGTIGVGLHPFGIAIADVPYPTLVYVSNNGSNTVSVIDTANNAIVASIAVGDRPSGMAINPAGTLTYVSNYGSGNVSAIDTLTQSVVATIPVSGSPVGIVFTPDGARAYVASSVTGVVSVIDTATHTVIAAVSGFAFAELGGDAPAGLAVTPNGAYVLVPNGQGTLYWIATSSNTVAGSIQLPVPNEGYVTVTADGRFAYVDGYFGYITKVDLLTRAVVQSFSVTGGAAGPALWQTAASDDGTTLYAASGGFNSVYVIDTGSMQTLTTIPVGSAPRGLAIKTGRAYVTDEGGTTVTVLDTTTRSVIEAIGVGVRPFGIALGEIPDATTLHVEPASAPYGSSVEVSASLTSPHAGPLPDRRIRFQLASSQFEATTGTDGVGRVLLDLADRSTGEYTLKASFDGDARFPASNGSATLSVTKAIPAVSWSDPAPIEYGNPLGAAQLNAAANVLGSFVYTPGAGSVLEAGTQSLTVTFTPADSANFDTVITTRTLEVVPAIPTLTLQGGGAFVFDGQPHALTATGVGAFGESLGPIAISYAPGGGFAPIDAGFYTTTATYAGNRNYTAATDGVNITITRAIPIVTLADETVVYDARAHAVPASVVGVLGEPLGPIVVSYRPHQAGSKPPAGTKTAPSPAPPAGEADGGSPGDLILDESWSQVPPTDAGEYDVRADFTGGLNYFSRTVQARLTILRAPVAVTVVSGTFTYDGLPHTASAFVTGVDGQDLGTATVLYDGSSAAPVDAGTYVATATFEETTNYQSSTGSANVVITPATATIAITGGQFVYDGQPHAGAAIAIGVLGEELEAPTIVYSGGTVPIGAGDYLVIATYGGSRNYQSTSVSTQLAIARATATVAVNGGTFTYDGHPHGATALVTGVFGEDLGPPALEYNGSPDVPSNAGTYSVTATFPGNANYLAGSASATVSIQPGAPTITVTGGILDYDGLPHTAHGTVVDINGQSIGSLTFTYNGSTAPPVGAGTYQVVGHFAGTGNYSAGTATALLSILKIPLIVTTVNASKVYGQPMPPLSVTYAGFVGADTPASLGGKVAFETTAGDASAAGSYTVTPSGLGSPNYAIEFLPGTLTITQASSLVTLRSSSNPAGYQQSFALTADVMPAPIGAGIATGTVEFFDGTARIASSTVVQGAAAINIILDPGTHALTARYSGDANVASGESQFTQTVNTRNASSTTSLKIKPGTSTYGEAVTFSVDVSTSGGAPIGDVEVRDGTQLLKRMALVNGGASFVVSDLPAGSHTLVAEYLGDTATGVPASTSSPVVLTVLDGTPLEKTSLRLSPGKPLTSSAPVLVDVIVNASGSTPTGPVALYADGALIPPPPPPSSQVLTSAGQSEAHLTFSVPPLPVGTHTITAIYGGDASHAGSTNEIRLQINK